MIVPAILTSFIEIEKLGILGYVMIFIVYLGLAFIATFFNVCTVYTVKKRFEGGNATFGESISFGFSKIHLIFAWSLVSATVGLILRIIDELAERLGVVGEIVVKIITTLLGAAWSILTIFVVPAMVYKNLGPIDAIKNSASTFKKTWGENIIKAVGLGLIQFCLLLVGVILGIILIISSLAISPILSIVFVGLTVLYVLAVILIFNVATSVFNTALYVYAEKGKVPFFSNEVMTGAFASKTRR
jgi:hypothetical protein